MESGASDLCDFCTSLAPSLPRDAAGELVVPAEARALDPGFALGFGKGGCARLNCLLRLATEFIECPPP